MSCLTAVIGPTSCLTLINGQASPVSPSSLLQMLVRPVAPVLDYRTAVTGLTAAELQVRCAQPYLQSLAAQCSVLWPSSRCCTPCWHAGQASPLHGDDLGTSAQAFTLRTCLLSCRAWHSGMQTPSARWCS